MACQYLNTDPMPVALIHEAGTRYLFRVAHNETQQVGKDESKTRSEKEIVILARVPLTADGPILPIPVPPVFRTSMIRAPHDPNGVYPQCVEETVAEESFVSKRALLDQWHYYDDRD